VLCRSRAPSSRVTGRWHEGKRGGGKGNLEKDGREERSGKVIRAVKIRLFGRPLEKKKKKNNQGGGEGKSRERVYHLLPYRVFPRRERGGGGKKRRGGKLSRKGGGKGKEERKAVAMAPKCPLCLSSSYSVMASRGLLGSYGGPKGGEEEKKKKKKKVLGEGMRKRGKEASRLVL